MACCDICGKNIGRLDSKRLKHNNYIIDVCLECDEYLQKLKDGDVDSYRKIHKHITDKKPEYVRMFVYCWEKVPDEIVKEKEQEKILAELEKEQQKQFKENLPELKKSFMATTGFEFSDYKIVNYLGIKSGDIVLGTGIAAEIEAAIADLLGAESEVMLDKLTLAKQKALNTLIENCIYSGANAVIGVDIDIMAINKNQLVVSANGTAVKIEKSIIKG